MSRKALKPEDFKIHIDSIYYFLESEKKYSQIRKFNSRFIHIKDTLLERKIILEKIIGNTNFYISNKDYVFFPKDYEYLLKQYQLKIRQANKKFFDNFVNEVNKKQLAPPPFENISTDEKLNELETGLKKFKEQSIEIKKTMDELFKINDDLEKENNKLLSEYKELESRYNKQVEEHAKRLDELVARNNLNVTEYSNYINEKLVEIADLKNKLLKENKIVCYKIFGITIFKVTTNKRN
jgi:hypothetical protein